MIVPYDEEGPPPQELLLDKTSDQHLSNPEELMNDPSSQPISTSPVSPSDSVKLQRSTVPAPPSGRPTPLQFKNVLIPTSVDLRPTPSQPPAKRRRLADRPDRETLTTDSPRAESPPSSPTPTGDHAKESNKVVWVDIGLEPNETYWWPGLVHEIDSESYVSLMPDPRCPSIDTRLKLISSFKATQPFKLHSDFEPFKLNPILKIKDLASKYPTSQKLGKAYVVAREKHVIYSFEEDDELPDLQTCMTTLSQESRAALAILSPKRDLSRASSLEPVESKGRKLRDELEERLEKTLDEPDQELEIPGETVISRTNPKSSQYWPAQVLRYAGLKFINPRGRPGRLKPQSEKLYELHFCDGNRLVVPRSFFLTTDQEEFYSVNVGKLRTTEVEFEHMIPQIQDQLHHLDMIIKGQSKNPETIAKHENFLESTKKRGEIPKDVKYGKYGEELVHKAGDFLTARYLANNSESSEKQIEVDPRFQRLSETQKNQYIFDVLVPELIWLITVGQYVEDAKEELRSEKSSTKRLALAHEGADEDLINESEEVLERAKNLANQAIQHVDLVDKVNGLRFRRKKSSSWDELQFNDPLDPEIDMDDIDDEEDSGSLSSQAKQRRRTKNSQRTLTT